MRRPTIKRRERDTIVQALRAGVVPKLGLQHIQVGRAREIEELVHDIERIGDGGASIRFVIGEYGSGKTFFLNLGRLIALEKGMVVLSADLAPDAFLISRTINGNSSRYPDEALSTRTHEAICRSNPAIPCKIQPN